MLPALKNLLLNQFHAALATLNACIERCPDASWDAPVVNYRFCQAVFHVLLFADFYLGVDEASFKVQAFHAAHPEYFRDYEEFADRPPTYLYDRATTKAYVGHCRMKAGEVIAAATEATLSAPAAQRPKLSRAELYVYNTRHVQHHAAQLGLRLRMDHGIDLPWVSLGWREF